MGWDGMGSSGWAGGVLCSLVCPSLTTSLPPGICKGLLFRAERAKGEKTVLANKLFAVYEQVKAELE